MDSILVTAKQALDKVKIQLMTRENTTFFATVCFSLKHIWDSSVSTAETDGISIYFNPEFFLKLNPEERLFLLLHETLHCALLHMTRIGDKHPGKWNKAADYVINLMLVKRGFRMPQMGLLDYQYEDMSTEQVYLLLPDTPEEDYPKDIREPRESPIEIEKQLEDIIVRASIQSKLSGEGIGSIPGEIQLFLDRLLDPKLTWKRILQKYLNTFAKNDYSLRKPNRRFFPTYHLPSLHSNALMDISIAVDISGSVTDGEFTQFISDIHSIMKMMKPNKLTLIQFDVMIKSVTQIRNVQELSKVQFIGRGGTKITPVVNWANENKPQLLIVFTDGGFHFHETKTKTDFIWVIHNNPEFTAPFGKVIHYEIES